MVKAAANADNHGIMSASVIDAVFNVHGCCYVPAKVISRH